MWRYPEINPVAIQLGPLAIHWYGLMYLIAFVSAWLLGNYRAKHTPGWNTNQMSDLIFYSAIGVVIGGRLGYVLFYNPTQLVDDPLGLLRIWEGGMSFHGGVLGVAAACYFFAKVQQKRFFVVADFVVPLVPLGLLVGRIGNFINGELWGRVSDVPWAMVFPFAGFSPRHPSQLYEAILEGLVLFIVIWWYTAKPRPPKTASGLFLVLYATMRILVEMVREPDAQVGFVFQALTRGQILSVPLLFMGLVLLVAGYRSRTVSI